jgi:hypothetical protein
MEDLDDIFFFPNEILSFIGRLEPGGLLPFEEVVKEGQQH